MPMAMHTIRIGLADDHELVRAGLRALLEQHRDFQILWEAADGQETLDAAERSPPDVLVLDLLMPHLNGFEVLARLRERNLPVRTLVVSLRVDVASVGRAFQEGAAGFLAKDAERERLPDAVRAVAQGRRYLNPELVEPFADDFLTQRPHPEGPRNVLTPRQRQVLQLIAEGNSTSRIASRLEISVKTVESHRANIMKRLDIHDVAGLVRYAVRHHIVSAEE